MEINILSPATENLSLISTQHPTYLLDGAIRFLQEFDQVTTIGDGDSCEVPNFQFDHSLPTDKNHSDFGHCLKILKENELKVINCYGFWTNLLYHSLSNLGEITQFLEHSSLSHFHLFNKNNEKMATCFNGTLNLNHRGKFSILPLIGARVSIEGKARYIIKSEYPHYSAALSSLMTSNYAEGDITIQASSPVIVSLEDA
jgi:thiamine pyrophosphokinase